MIQLKNFILHFILGGVIVSFVTFVGSQGKGLLASFVAIFPATTVLTFILIYHKGGQVATLNYAKGMLWMTPAWIFYVFAIIFLLPRIGLAKSLITGVLAYMVFSWITSIIISRLG